MMARACKDCDQTLRKTNKHGYCRVCRNRHLCRCCRLFYAQLSGASYCLSCRRVMALRVSGRATGRHAPAVSDFLAARVAYFAARAALGLPLFQGELPPLE